MAQIIFDMEPRKPTEFAYAFQVSKRIATDLVRHASRVKGGEVSALAPHFAEMAHLSQSIINAPDDDTAREIIRDELGVDDPARGQVSIRRVGEIFGEIPVAAQRDLRELWLKKGYSVVTPTQTEMAQIYESYGLPHTGEIGLPQLSFVVRKSGRLGRSETVALARAHRLKLSELMIRTYRPEDLIRKSDPKGNILLVSLVLGLGRKVSEEARSSLFAAVNDYQVLASVADPIDRVYLQHYLSRQDIGEVALSELEDWHERTETIGGELPFIYKP